MLFWMYLLVHIPLPLQDNADLHTCLLDEEVSRSTGKEEGQIHHRTLYRTLYIFCTLGGFVTPQFSIPRVCQR